MDKEFYLGLDIGTDSVGYAVTDTQYNVLKFHGERAWGIHLFEEAKLAEERRSFRTARRRLDRRQARVQLIQELFAKEVAKVDSRFFIRQQESALYRTDKTDSYSIFNDPNYTDKDYHQEYPTIHHLLYDLMTSYKPHDVRLVCLACEWLVAHRGHFLSEIDLSNIDKITDFSAVYDELRCYFTDNDKSIPWDESNLEEFGNALKLKANLSSKYKKLSSVCFPNSKVPKEALEEFPYNCEALLKLLCGSSVSPKDLFLNPDYSEIGSFTLGDDDEKLSEILGSLGDDATLIEKLKTIYDWALLVDILGGYTTVSQSKVEVYNTHKSDLALLKRFVRKYAPKSFDSFFRGCAADAYTAYSYHGDTSDIKRKASKEDFGKTIKKLLKGITVDADDSAAFNDMMTRIDMQQFMPKQRDTDNRVIPRQLYEYELNLILERASAYLPFLNDKDEDGLSVADKIKSVFSFRVPYFVGPLNPASGKAWIVRKAGRITPWNFDSMVDLDASETCFINKLVGKCTYLPGENALPKDSLLYHRFTVLNEINNLKVNGAPISTEAKQYIYNNAFLRTRKVSLKRISESLIIGGFMQKGDIITGIDTAIKSDLKPQHDFARLIGSGILTEEQVESIIERSSYSEDKSRFSKWLEHQFPQLCEADRKYIARLKYNDFGRLSRRFLTDIVCEINGKSLSIISAMWETNLNLMELLSDKYSYSAQVEAEQQEYYAANSMTDEKRLDEMYISNAVKRPILRSMAVVDDVIKAFGAPSKIFIEMARGGKPEQKGKRTLSRKAQILSLYEKIQNEDVRLLTSQLESMGESADSRLQSDKLFLYYMQLGKCLYTGTPIDLESLMHGNTGEYNIEHIFPQSLVKDDSILNNEILVSSKANGEKSDSYPVSADIQAKMSAYWYMLLKNGLMTDEKYNRLTRTTPFSDNEKWGFINRQLTETTQSTKAVAQLLKDRLPDTEIVYVKSRLASEFRQEFGCIKSRLYNDLHHAKDAYLNIVVGNVYNSRFTSRWFSVRDTYSLNTDVLFTRPLVLDGVTIWAGASDKDKVVKNLSKNNIHMTRYAFCRHGGYFDQMPVKASAGLVPLKSGRDTSIYGGYNKPFVSFFMIVSYRIGKKSDVMVMPVELLYADKVLNSSDAAEAYAMQRIGDITGKKVDNVSFPMGLKALKVNSVLSFDGYRMYITGTANGGQILLLSSFVAFKADTWVERYLKYLERFVEKASSNNHIYNPVYDNVTIEMNNRLYQLYINKLNTGLYSLRPNTPNDIILNGASQFTALDILEQSKTLLTIHSLFCRLSGGIDLTSIGGTAHGGATKLSSNSSNWKKRYHNIRIIYSSPSGLWEHTSENLLDLK